MYYHLWMQARDQRGANRDYYRRNRSHELARVRVRQDATRDMLRALRERPCTDCGATFLPHQMDFDHRDPRLKAFRLTSGRAMLASAAIETEVEKCDVVCANCHRVRTWRRNVQGPIGHLPVASRELERKREYWRAQAALLADLKNVPCLDCGQRFAACAMDFDHRQPGSKRHTVSRMIGRAGTATILAEVAECDIVCANCHRHRTFRRREVVASGRE